MIIENLFHITVVYFDTVKSVRQMVENHYDKPEYDGTVFFLNTFSMFEEPEFKPELFKDYKRKIYYMLEHRVYDSDKYWESPQVAYDISVVMNLGEKIGITEFWTMDYEPQLAQIVRERLNIPIVFRPVRYTSFITPVDNIKTTYKTVDFCHIGKINNPHRLELLSEHEYNNTPLSFKFLTGTRDIASMIPELNTARYIVDTVRTKDMMAPNQVRIFELLCMGYTVCVEKTGVNMFPGLVYEWSTLGELHRIRWNLSPYLSPTEAYFSMTYYNEDYENYINYLIDQYNAIQRT